jgi:hypothetical protein
LCSRACARLTRARSENARGHHAGGNRLEKVRQQRPQAAGNLVLVVDFGDDHRASNGDKHLAAAAGQLVFVNRTINMSLFTSHPILVVGAIIMQVNQRIPRECSSSQAAEQVEDYMDGDDDGQVWRSIGRQLRQISEHYQVETSKTSRKKDPTDMITSVESIKFEHQTECLMLPSSHRTALYSRLLGWHRRRRSRSA